MSNRTLSILSVIVSALGVIVSIVTVLFTQYKVVSLISLFVVEIFVVALWFYYARQRNKLVNPYPYESQFLSLRYLFDSPNTMSFECIEILRITQPNVPGKAINLIWSGKGSISLETPLLTQKPEFTVDGKTGQVGFYYPTLPNRKFGDTAVIHFIVKLEDASHENKPELYSRITCPAKLVALEVVLKYKEKSAAAWFGHRAILDIPSAFLPYEKLADLPFDEATKSYRITIPNPTLQHMYQIKWDK